MYHSLSEDELMEVNRTEGYMKQPKQPEQAELQYNYRKMSSFLESAGSLQYSALISSKNH